MKPRDGMSKERSSGSQRAQRRLARRLLRLWPVAVLALLAAGFAACRSRRVVSEAATAVLLHATGSGNGAAAGAPAPRLAHPQRDPPPIKAGGERGPTFSAAIEAAAGAGGQAAPAEPRSQRPAQAAWAAVKAAPSSTKAARRQQGGGPLQGPTPRRPSGPARMKHPVWWHAPIWSGTGYGGEAINFLLSILRAGVVHRDDVWASNHGASTSDAFVAGMAPADLAEIRYAEALPGRSLQQEGGGGSGGGGGGGSPVPRSAIVVCHSMPFFYTNSEGWWGAGEPCPPNKTKYPYSYTIGRTMYETDSVTWDFARRCNQMDEVWVPSAWQAHAFMWSGVHRLRLRVVPEGVNTTFLDPSKHQPLPDLEARAELVFGPTPRARQEGDAASARDVRAANGGDSSGSGGGSGGGSGSGGNSSAPPFKFLSAFKWEARKGWDLLLEAYLSEFTQADNVQLIMLTKKWDGAVNETFEDQISQWASDHLTNAELAAPVAPSQSSERRHLQRRRALGSYLRQPGVRAGSSSDQGSSGVSGGDRGASSGGGGGGGGGEAWVQHTRRGILQTLRGRLPKAAGGGGLDVAKLPALYIIDTHLTDDELPRLYKSVDAFVLPSRGEGWGRPHVEAMSMGLPVISTNWSGITAFLDDSVGYPIAVEALEQADGWVQGLHWARPSVPHLRQLMRRVYENRDEAVAKGRAARARMVERYSPGPIAELLMRELRRIDAMLG